MAIYYTATIAPASNLESQIDNRKRKRGKKKDTMIDDEDNRGRFASVFELSGLVQRKESEAERAILEWKLFLDLDRANGSKWNAFRIGRSAGSRENISFVLGLCARDSENSIKRKTPAAPRKRRGPICISNAARSEDKYLWQVVATVCSRECHHSISTAVFLPVFPFVFLSFSVSPRQIFRGLTGRRRDSC